jgi:hypothetical protein
MKPVPTTERPLIEDLEALPLLMMQPPITNLKEAVTTNVECEILMKPVRDHFQRLITGLSSSKSNNKIIATGF